MNIFYLDKSPKLSAKYHNDKHTIKMILESAQLLCTAHILLDNNDNGLLYKATHKNHPSAVWVRQSKQNYLWLYELFVELSKEYTFRYNKVHKTYTKLKDILAVPPSNIPDTDFTEPPLCMPDECKLEDVIESYRNYYMTEKRNIAVWKTEKPYWYV